MLLHKNPNPQKHTRLGHVRARKPARRDLPLKQLEQKVASALVVEPQAAHPAVEAREAPAGEQERDERLREAGRVLRGEVDVADEVRLECWLGCYPAETEAWGHDLTEAIDRSNVSESGLSPLGELEGEGAHLSMRITRPSMSIERNDKGNCFLDGGASVFGGSYCRK